MRYRLISTLLLLSLSGNVSCDGPSRSRIIIGIAINQRSHSAVELAAREINEGGGICGVPIEMHGFDWGSDRPFDATEVLALSRRLSGMDDLVAVIGHSDSDSTLSAAAIYNQNRVPQIVTIATNPSITNIGEWTYRLCISDAIQGPALADYAVRDWGKQRIAVFHVNDAYGRELARLFESHARELGAQIVGSFMHRDNLHDDDVELIKLAVARAGRGSPDLFVLFQRMDAAHKTIREVRASLATDILGGDSLSPLYFIEGRENLLEGMRVSQFFAARPEDERARRFIERMRAIEPETQPDYAAAFAYDAVYLIRDALLGGGLSRDGVKSYLDRAIRERRVMHGVAGPYFLGPDHDARRALNIVEVRNGAQEFLKALLFENP